MASAAAARAAAIAATNGNMQTQTKRANVDTIQSKKQQKNLISIVHTKKKIAWKKERARARQLKRKKDLSGGKICE